MHEVLHIETWYLIATIAIIALITFALRALPFIAGTFLQRWPMMRFLAQFLPPAIMLLLVMHTTLGLTRTHDRGVMVELLSVVVVVVLHLWCNNALLSILCGTGLYLAVLNFF